VKERLWRAVCVATMGLVALGSARARADESGSLGLEWNADEECPDRAAAEAAVLEILGERAPSDANSNLVRVDITRLPNERWEVRIVTHGEAGNGQRRFEGSSCERVAEAAILIVAMTLDAVGVAHQVKADRAAAKRVTAAPSPTAEGLRPSLGARVPFDSGSLPSPTLGLGAVFGVEGGRARLEGEAVLWVPQQALTGPTPGSGVEIGLYTGGARGCLDAVRAYEGQLRVGACLGGELGVTTGSTVRLDPAVRQSGLWAAGLGGLTLRHVNSSGLAYGASADLGVPIRRPSFVINNFGPLFQASPAVFRASLSVAWIFP
jgi:hypothetical protein